MLIDADLCSRAPRTARLVPTRRVASCLMMSSHERMPTCSWSSCPGMASFSPSPYMTSGTELRSPSPCSALMGPRIPPCTAQPNLRLLSGAPRSGNSATLTHRTAAQWAVTTMPNMEPCKLSPRMRRRWIASSGSLGLYMSTALEKPLYCSSCRPMRCCPS